LFKNPVFFPGESNSRLHKKTPPILANPGESNSRLHSQSQSPATEIRGYTAKANPQRLKFAATQAKSTPSGLKKKPPLQANGIRGYTGKVRATRD
jgi:hypothetical protein